MTSSTFSNTVRLVAAAVLAALLVVGAGRPAAAGEGDSTGYSYSVDEYLSWFHQTGGLSGDYAAAIITAHEYGHHVQDELYQQWRAQGYDVLVLIGDAEPGGLYPHGSPKERVAALETGYYAAGPMQCVETYWTV